MEDRARPDPVWRSCPGFPVVYIAGDLCSLSLRQSDYHMIQAVTRDLSHCRLGDRVTVRRLPPNPIHRDLWSLSVWLSDYHWHLGRHGDLTSGWETKSLAGAWLRVWHSATGSGNTSEAATGRLLQTVTRSRYFRTSSWSLPGLVTGP